MSRWRWNIFQRRPVREATRRAWCRLAFLSLGLLPVMLTFIVSLAEFLPAYQRMRVSSYERSLSLALGLPVRLDRVELLAPNKRYLHGFRLLHPETQELMLQSRCVWVSESPTGVAINMQAARLPAEQLLNLQRLLHDGLLCRPLDSAQAAVLWLNGAVIEGPPSQRAQFQEVHAELRRTRRATSAALTFDLAGMSGQRAQLTFSRQHDDAIPASQLKLSTGGQRLPCPWIAAVTPEMFQGVSQATFSGQYQLTYNEVGWNLHGAGRLHDLDASMWFDRPVLAGTADVDISRILLTNSALHELSGRVSIRDGRMHTDLMKSLNPIGIRAADSRGADSTPATLAAMAHPFSLAAAGFRLGSDGLKITPLLPNQAIAIDPVGPLAIYYAPVDYPIPLQNLVISLSLRDQPNDVLRSPTARHLVRWLPGTHLPAQSDQVAHQASQ